MKKMWLQCEISEGQFTGEFAVKGVDSAGKYFSLFVNADCLDSQHELLRVTEIARQDGDVLIELPQVTFENGKTVTVPSGNLSPVEDREFA